MSPWSEVSTTMVSSARPHCLSVATDLAHAPVQRGAVGIVAANCRRTVPSMLGGTLGTEFHRPGLEQASIRFRRGLVRIVRGPHETTSRNGSF